MDRLRRFAAVLSALIALRGAVAAAQATESSPKAIVGVRVEHAPVLDGTLGDPIWETAAVVDRFSQREPQEGKPSSERTVVRILYDKRFLYLGVDCRD